MMRSPGFPFRVILVFLAVAGGSSAQQQPPVVRSPGVIEVTTRLVQLDVVVTDDQGRPVTDLSRSDFEILEDGKPQPVTAFSLIPAGPRVGANPGASALSQEQVRRTIALVVDDFTVPVRPMIRVREVLNRFLNSETRDGDLMALLALGNHQGAFEQFTTDRALLRFLVTRLEFNPVQLVMKSPTISIQEMMALEALDVTRGQAQALDESPLLEALQSFGEVTVTSLRALVDSMKGMPGRKSIVLFSTGVPDGLPLRHLIDVANRAGITFYTIDPRDPPPVGERYDGPPQHALATLAAETGGRSWEARENLGQSLTGAFADQDFYYLLGYNPGDGTFDRRFHKLEVKVLRSGLRVRSRSEFEGKPDAPEAEPRDSAGILGRLIASPYRNTTMRTTLTSFFSADGGTPTLRSTIFIDGRDLQAERTPEGVYRGAVEMMAAIVDPGGQISGQVKRGLRFSLTAEGWRRASTTGMAFTLPHPVGKPGPYHVRLAVRDAVSGETGSASSFLLVPDLKNDRLALSGLVLSAPSTEADPYPLSSPAVRTFIHGRDVGWLMEVYNAKTGPRSNNGLPQLQWSALVYRDGQRVHETPFAAAEVRKLDRGKDVSARNVLETGSALEPGEYVLQIKIRDQNGETAEISQVTNFRVVPGSAR